MKFDNSRPQMFYFQMMDNLSNLFLLYPDDRVEVLVDSSSEWRTPFFRYSRQEFQNLNYEFVGYV